MKFTKERSQMIKHYILEKIDRNDRSIAAAAAENFGINVSTVHSYLNEMIKDGIISRTGRSNFKLVKKEYHYLLDRNNKNFFDDMFAYKQYLYPCIKDLESNVANIWGYVMGEMTNNVIDHSQTETVEIHICQDFLKTRVMLMDHGVGIFKKIKDYFGFESLQDAICELFKGKLTTDSKNHSGEGIFFSSKLMDEFLVISDGYIFSCDRYDDSQIADLLDTVVNGTCVLMELSNFSNKQPKDIFELYTDEDFQFSKTMIPVKNIFDNDPVSRSQAKRLCNRLEKFNDVILDFKGVQWIGQGFAHQVFVVFAGEHKDMRIIAENMNSDVEKMYKHVINTSLDGNE